MEAASTTRMEEEEEEEEEEAAKKKEVQSVESSDKLSYEIFSILESKFLFGYGGTDGLWLTVPSLSDEERLVVEEEEQAVAAAPAPAIKNQRGKVCVLCIDSGGGGVGGAVAAGKVLAHLEKALQRSSGDAAARVSDFFDVAAGSGAGGVFAAMLFAARRGGGSGGRPLFRADDTWRLVADHGDRLFPRPKAPTRSITCGLRRPRMKRKTRAMEAAAAAMEKVLKEAFGEELTLRDTLKPVLIPCYDMRVAAPLVFSRADAVESASFDFRLWEVCRATWAEPGRGVAPAEVRSVDGATTVAAAGGALAMSNPAAAAITHVLHNKEEFPFVRGVEDIVVVSIGCGGVGNGIGIDGGLRGAGQWGPEDWAQPIARIAADGAADLVDHSVAMAFGQWRSTNYVRIQASGSSMVARCGGDSECDPGPSNVKALTVAAEDMLRQKNVESVLFCGRRIGEETNAERLDWFAGKLVLEHQTRSCRIAPTVAFKQPPPRPS